MKLLYERGELRKKIGNAALELIKHNFSVQEMTDKTMEIYKRLVDF